MTYACRVSVPDGAIVSSAHSTAGAGHIIFGTVCQYLEFSHHNFHSDPFAEIFRTLLHLVFFTMILSLRERQFKNICLLYERQKNKGQMVPCQFHARYIRSLLCSNATLLSVRNLQHLFRREDIQTLQEALPLHIRTCRFCTQISFLMQASLPFPLLVQLHRPVQWPKP